MILYHKVVIAAITKQWLSIYPETSLVPRPLHHSAKKNGLLHEVQILGSVPRNEEQPISSPLIEKWF